MRIRTRHLIPALCFLAMSCLRTSGEHELADEILEIYPDYLGVTIPPNIAPLNFKVKGEGDRFAAEIFNSKGKSLLVRGRKGHIQFPANAWRRMLEEDRGGALTLKVYVKRKGASWEAFPPVVNPIAKEDIDPYIAYRKIGPGHIVWGEMGIYQRSLESFREDPVMVNKVTGKNCINCHTFNTGDPGQMIFHMRGSFGGTFMSSKKGLQFVDTRSDHTRSAGAYASWHPGGELIAFSVNKISQAFHSQIGKNIHVFDSYSDIVLYDLESNSLTRPAELASARLENLPTWSDDGRSLYYIATGQPADSLPFTSRRYDLMRIEFDEASRKFGKSEMLIDAEALGKSVSFPRKAPGRDLMAFIGLDYGYFSIFNKESDVYLYDLKRGRIYLPEINSGDTESYPSWSGNGSWLMFVSKREDGLFSQVWFSHVDEKGKAGKPFLLPQKNADFHVDYLLNYNRPEFISGKVWLNPRRILPIIQEGPRATGFNKEGSVSISSGPTVPVSQDSREHYHHY